MAGNNSAGASVGILSIGDMGVGIAQLIQAHGFRVLTNASDRRQASPEATKERARKNGIELLSSDIELCNTADYVLSIVPPRDAIATARRILEATSSAEFAERANPLYFIDLNAVSPRTSRLVDDLLSHVQQRVRFIDGGIIGGPPRLHDEKWIRPSIPVSGPYKLASAAPSGAKLAEVLNVQHVNNDVGAATGLKMCFASLSKGFTALSIESFTTAQTLGVTDHLREHLEGFNPMAAKTAERGLVSMPPKAYRWVHEMDEIAETFEDAGFEQSESIFRPIARVYDFVARGTELGKEITEDRKRGTTGDDVASLMGEGLRRRKENVK